MSYEKRGKGLMVFVDGAAIAYTTNHTLSINAQITEDSRTKDEALGPAGDFDHNEWDVSVDSIMGVGTGENYSTLIAKMLAQQYDDDDDEACELVFDAVDPTLAAGAVPTGGWEAGETAAVYPATTGTAYIDELSFTAGESGYATMSAKFMGVSEIETL